MYNNRNQGMHVPVKVGEEYQVHIEAVGDKGDGICKVEGFVIFVPNVKEGDNVKIRVNKVLRKVGFGEVIGEAEQPEEEPQYEDTEDFGEEPAVEGQSQEEVPAGEENTREESTPGTEKEQPAEIDLDNIEDSAGETSEQTAPEITDDTAEVTEIEQQQAENEGQPQAMQDEEIKPEQPQPDAGNEEKDNEEQIEESKIGEEEAAEEQTQDSNEEKDDGEQKREKEGIIEDSSQGESESSADEEPSSDELESEKK